MSDFRLEVENINRSRSTVRIGIDKQWLSAVSRRLKPYKNVPNTMRSALLDVADYIRSDMIPETFKQEGPGWAPLAPRTVEERVRAGYRGRHPILYRTGDLFRELTDRTHPRHVEVVKVGKHSRIEIGGSSQKFIDNQLGRADTNLPARPMIPGTGALPLRDRDRDVIENILRKAIRGAK